MPLSYEDTMALRNAGFISLEIEAFSKAEAPDGTPQVINIHSATWQAMIESRRRWVADKRARGWPDKIIGETILRYYITKASRSPFDFVKAEYKPPRRMSDYQAASRKRARAKVGRLYRRT